MLIDERLYLPEKWVDDRERCLRAKIPSEEIRFRTKHENRGLSFVADIPSNTQVYLTKPVVGIPARKGNKGRKPTIPKVLNTTPVKVRSLSSEVEGWKFIKVRNTERGYKEVYFMAIRVWRRQNDLPTEKPLWLLISKDVESDEMKYSFCNASEDTSFDKLAKMQSSRYWIERAFDRTF
jgi:hypothetical protein